MDKYCHIPPAKFSGDQGMQKNKKMPQINIGELRIHNLKIVLLFYNNQFKL